MHVRMRAVHYNKLMLCGNIIFSMQTGLHTSGIQYSAGQAGAKKIKSNENTHADTHAQADGAYLARMSMHEGRCVHQSCAYTHDRANTVSRGARRRANACVGMRRVRTRAANDDDNTHGWFQRTYMNSDRLC